MQNDYRSSTSRFIAAIKLLPILYNTSHLEYQLHDKKKKLWEDIATEFNLTSMIKKVSKLIFFTDKVS